MNETKISFETVQFLQSTQNLQTNIYTHTALYFLGIFSSISIPTHNGCIDNSKTRATLLFTEKAEWQVTRGLSTTGLMEYLWDSYGYPLEIGLGYKSRPSGNLLYSQKYINNSFNIEGIQGTYKVEY